MHYLLLLPDWASGDWSKLLLFALAIVALWFVMRVARRRSESQDFSPAGVGSADQLGAGMQVPSVHPSMRFEQIELRSFYMREFDVMTGPPDPFEFVDELTAEIEHVETGTRSKWEFTIGTPSGFARLLEGKNWESFYSPEIFVIRKYELEIVREMIVDHISSVLADKPVDPTKQSARDNLHGD